LSARRRGTEKRHGRTSVTARRVARARKSSNLPLTKAMHALARPTVTLRKDDGSEEMFQKVRIRRAAGRSSHSPWRSHRRRSFLGAAHTRNAMSQPRLEESLLVVTPWPSCGWEKMIPHETLANFARSRKYERYIKFDLQSALARPAILESQAAYAQARKHSLRARAGPHGCRQLARPCILS
jgi:hypothetical protein